MKSKHFHLLIPLTVFFFYCTGKGKESGSASHHSNYDSSYSYDLNHPVKKWILSHDLKEISGQAWIDKDHLLVIEDLHTILYLVKLGDTASIEKAVPFKDVSDKKKDIEDVAIVNNVVYALWSHGTLYKIKNWETDLKTKKLETPLSKEDNTEGLCYDPVSHNLLIACKNEADTGIDKKSTRSVYEFDLSADTLVTTPFMLIQDNDFKKFVKENIDFYPSAIAVHPFSHDIYILSTKDTKGMAVYSYKGELKSFQYIDENLLIQPEGICFAPDGTMYISSEGKHHIPPVLMEFKYLK